MPCTAVQRFSLCASQNLAPFKLLILNNVTFFYWPVNYFRSINIVGSFHVLNFYSILIQSWLAILELNTVNISAFMICKKHLVKWKYLSWEKLMILNHSVDILSLIWGYLSKHYLLLNNKTLCNSTLHFSLIYWS